MNSECRIQNSEWRQRRGTSILEVIIAILIATIGLLGAAAVFPVANAVAYKGRVNDQTAASGRAAISIFDSMGMRRPDMWAAWNPAIPAWDGFPSATAAAGGSFIPLPGESYCLDPRCLAMNGNSTATQFFPLRPTTLAAAQYPPSMRRMTLRNMPLGGPMGQLQADDIFILDDELVCVRPGQDDTETDLSGIPADRSLPAFGKYEPYGGSVPFSRRRLDRNYSWMATLVPKINAYLPDASNDEYVLSIVVFHKRPADVNADGIGKPDNDERIVDVMFQTGAGPTGGEVVLHWNSSSGNDDQAEKVLKLNANDWICLSGVQVGPTGVTVPRFGWFRVTHCDREVAYNGSPAAGFSSAGYELNASLAGSDWNLSVFNPKVAVGNTASATLMTGVVGVYEKTIRLEYGDSL